MYAPVTFTIIVIVITVFFKFICYALNGHTHNGDGFLHIAYVPLTQHYSTTAICLSLRSARNYQLLHWLI